MNETRWTSGVIPKAAATLLAVLLLYVLSFGPVFGYAIHSFAKSSTVEMENRLRRAQAVYAPILWIASRNQTIEQIGSAYVFFFVEKVFASK